MLLTKEECFYFRSIVYPDFVGRRGYSPPTHTLLLCRQRYVSAVFCYLGAFRTEYVVDKEFRKSLGLALGVHVKVAGHFVFAVSGVFLGWYSSLKFRSFH